MAMITLKLHVKIISGKCSDACMWARVHNIYREESIELPIRPSNTLRKVMTQSVIDTFTCRPKMSLNTS